jgi:hypothetical protein
MTKKGKEVMLTDRVKRNVSQYHWVLAVSLEHGVNSGFRVQSYTGKKALAHTGYPFRRVQ